MPAPVTFAAGRGWGLTLVVAVTLARGGWRRTSTNSYTATRSETVTPAIAAMSHFLRRHAAIAV